MAPVSVASMAIDEAVVLPKHDLHLPGRPSTKFDILRRIVPLVSEQDVIHLNAAFMPPSNLIIRGAIDQFCERGLHHSSPKPLWKKDVEETRKLIAQYLNAEPSSIAFTRDATEAMGSFMHSLDLQPGDNVVILDCEHPNQAYGWLSLQKKGIEVRQVPTSLDDPSAANAATFAPFVDDRTRCIGLSSIMFHNGQWNDIRSVVEAFKPRGIQVLADLTQQVGFTPVDIQTLGVSAAAFSLHKGFNAPTGIAVLYVSDDFISRRNPVPPIVSYGSVASPSEDFQVSPGPISFHPTARRYEHANMCLIGAVAAKAYLQFYLDVIIANDVQSHLYKLGHLLRQGCQNLGVGILGPISQHAPHLYTLQLYGTQWRQYFEDNSVIVSIFHWGVRVSFGFYNDRSDVSKFLGLLERGIKAGMEKD